MTRSQKVPHYPGFEAFHARPVAERLGTFERDGEPYDLIFSQQLSPAYCARLFALANTIRRVAKTKAGLDHLGTVASDKRAMLFFTQPSTRTFLSFLNACHILGIKTSEIRNAETSSEVKGESPEDTIRTFSSYVDLVIIRHREEGSAERCAWVLNQTKRPVPVINGGSGKDEHPTQALLDLYTLWRAFGKSGGTLHNRHVAMVGDLRRGRTVRSLAQLLASYPGVRFTFVAPPAFQMGLDVLSYLDGRGVPYTLQDALEPVIPLADALYLTRIQDEYDEAGESSQIDYSRYHFQTRHLAMLRPDAVVLHPFPRRMEVEVGVDSDPRALYWKQQRNGMWVRSALMARLFRRDDAIQSYAERVPA